LVKFIRNKAVSIGLTAGVLIGAIFLAQRFNVGGKIAEGFGGLGAFFPNLAKSFASGAAGGAGGLGEELVKISENFQRALGGGLLLSEQTITGGGGFVGGTANETLLTTQVGQQFPTFLKNAFTAFEPAASTKNKRSTTKIPDPENVFNVAKAFNPGAQAKRVSLQAGTSFGGFGSAQEQEKNLQTEIAKSRQLFPQFFNIGG